MTVSGTTKPHVASATNAPRSTFADSTGPRPGATPATAGASYARNGMLQEIDLERLMGHGPKYGIELAI